MPSDSIHFELEDVAPEVELGLRALTVELMALGARVTIEAGGSASAGTIVVCSEANPTPFENAWRVAQEIPGGRLRFTRAGESMETAWRMPDLSAQRRHPPVILVSGGKESRRTRMVCRTAEELVRRRISCRVAVWRAIEHDGSAAGRAFAEVHLEPTALELGRLLSSATLVFEPADDPADFSPLPWMAEAAAIPLVVPTSHPLGSGGGVVDWSAESFADAIERSLDGPSSAERPIDGDAGRLLEAFGLAR